MLCIVETWLNSDVMDAEVFLENSSTFRGARHSGGRGGGVAVYVKSEFLPRCFSLDFNTVACQIPHPSHLLTVLGVYIYPISPEADDEQIIRAIRLVANQPGICLILEILTLHTSIGSQAHAQP